MAGMTNHAESDLLRAVTHARMHVTSGRGLESVIHDLASANLGIVSQAVAQVEKEMTDGRDAEQALAYVADNVDNDNMRTFLNALRTPGEAAVARLDDLTQNIQADWNFAIERYGARVSGLTQFAAVLFVATFVPTIVRVVAAAPIRDGAPLLDLPNSFEPTVYGSLSVIISILVLLLRIR